MTTLDLPALKKLCLEASALPWHFSAAGFTKDAEGNVVSLDYRQEQIEKNEKFLLEATTAIPKLIEVIEINQRLIEERNRVLAEFECSIHGECVPGAIEQIRAIKKENQSLKAEMERLEKQHQWDNNALGMQIEVNACTSKENQSLRGLLMEIGPFLSGHKYPELRERIDAALGEK